jgi:predicted MFS family arabinose efflux permease
VPLIGVGLGFFWPSVQAGFSEVFAGRDLHRMVRLLNVSWSLGKGMGLLLGGLLLESLGAQGVSLLAALAFGVAAVAVPWMDRPGDHSQAVEEDERVPTIPRRIAFLRSAWIANAATFAVAATLNHHLPRVVRGHGMDAGDFGLFMGVVFFAQTLWFALVGPMRWWHFRAAPLLGVQIAVIAGVLGVGHLTSIWSLLLLAPPLGFGLGFAYQSSIYYSLHAPVGRGRQAGVHEAALGIASASIPLAGGALVATRGLYAPFAVAALAAGVATVSGLFWLARTRER